MSGKSANSFSDFMHPRNPYRRYDYETLAKCSLEFKSYLKEAVSKDPAKPTKFFLDWTDREAVRCLMKCCLRRDFQLDLVRGINQTSNSEMIKLTLKCYRNFRTVVWLRHLPLR